MPVADIQSAITARPRSMLLMQVYQLLEKLAHQNQEHIHERTVHAKGSGKHGMLTIPHEIVQSPCPGPVQGKFLAARS